MLHSKAYHNKAISRRFILSPAYSVGLFLFCSKLCAIAVFKLVANYKLSTTVYRLLLNFSLAFILKKYILASVYIQVLII